MVRRLALISCALFIFVISRGSDLPANAQVQAGTTGLTVIPPLYIYDLAPGQSITNTVRVQNIDSRSRLVNVSPQNFVADQEGRGCVPTESNTETPLAQWLTADPTQHNFEPSEQFTFNFTLSIPADAEPGGHYGALVFQIVPGEDDKDAVGVKSFVQGATCFLVNVQGDVRLGANIKSFTAGEKEITEPANPNATPGTDAAAETKKAEAIHFSTAIRNTGNTHIQPTGQIFVKNLLGHEYSPFDMEPGQGKKYVLPKTTRVFENDWKKPGIGFYRAKVIVFYDTDHPQLVAETSFWVLPPLWVWAVVVVVLLLLVWLFKSRRRIRKAMRAFRDS